MLQPNKDKVNEDLTMLKPQKTRSELAFEELLKNVDNSEPSAPDTSGIRTQEDYSNYIRKIQNESDVAGSVRDQVADADLDANRSMFETTDQVRSRNQNGFIKGLKAVGGGILQGGLIALEQAGYVADIDTYTNLFTEVDDLSGNWWTQLMKESQDKLRESNAFKIYEDAPDVNSLSSQIFKWTSLEGAVSSAVGFGITGLGAAKLVSYLGSMGKFKELAAFTDLTMGNITGKNMVGATKAFTGPLASSAMSNYFMGQMMATDTFNQSMDSLKGAVARGELSLREAQELSSAEAQDVVGLNMALTATAYIKFGGIFKRKNKIKGLVENPTAMNQMKQLIKAGSITGFTENVYQEMIQMEQFHDVAKSRGEESQYSDNYWDRMTQLALSDRAMHAGALGVVGGPIQFAIIQRPMMGKQLEHQRNVYENQQERLKWNEALVQNNFDIFNQYDSVFNEALVKGDINAAIMNDDFQLMNELSKQVEWGTLPILKKDMEDIMKATPEEAAEKGITAEDYKETAEKMLGLISKTERALQVFAGKSNTGEIVHNLLIADRIQEEILNIKKERQGALEKIHALVKDEITAELSVDDKGNIGILRDPNRFDGMKSSDTAKARVTEAKEQSRLGELLATTNDYKTFKKTVSNLKKHENFARDIQKKFEEITTDGYEKSYVEKQDKARKEYKKTAEKQAKGVEEKESIYTDFNEVQVNPNPLTNEELKTKLEEWDKVKDTITTNAILPTTFSGIDTDGNVRAYTPGELVRSNDGRTFKVVHQNKNPFSKYAPHKFMPVLIKVNEDGSAIKGEKRFTLEDHGFLREESLQPFVKRDKSSGFGYAKNWGVYPKTDSLLKPQDFNYQVSRIGLAEEGKVAGINISANMLKKGDFEWLSDYNHQLLSLPFDGETEVIYRLNKQGERHTYIDVFQKQPDGTEIKLTRLNKDSNLNHESLIKLLSDNKGEVTGKKVGHFSSRYNLVKDYDTDGNVIYSPISELQNINPQYLIDGQIVLAQTGGDKYLVPDAARGLDGKIYGDGTIDVPQADGSVVARPIPYDSMRVGDTYALVLAPTGEITPIALSSDNLGKLPEKKQKVLNAWEEAITEGLAEHLENELEADEKLRTEIENSNDVADDPIAQQAVFVDRKRERIFEAYHKKDGENSPLWGAMSKKLHNLIRPVTFKSTIIGHTFGGKPRVAKTANGKVQVPENYFEPTVDVSSDGEFVPAIKTRNPKNHAAFRTYNIKDHREEFFALLDNKRPRVSIDMLTDVSTDGKEEMSNIIHNSGLKVDINTKTPFVGASGTFTVDGADFKEMSASDALVFNKYLRKKFPKESKFIDLSVDKTEQTIDEFNFRLAELLEFKDSWLADVSTSDTVQELVGNFSDLIRSLRITQEREALSIVENNITEELVDSSKEEEYNEILSKLESRGINNNKESLARGVLGLNIVMEEVNSGKMTLKDKQRRKSDEDPTGLYIQPEDLTFRRGVLVFHEEYGDATFDRVLKDGKYRIKTKSGKLRIVYPGDTYNHDGIRAKISRLNKKLSDVDINSETHVALTNAKLRLTTQLAIQENYKVQQVKDEESVSYEDTIEDTSDPILEAKFESIGTNVGGREATKLFTATARTRYIVDKLNNLELAVNTAEKLGNTPITADQAADFNSLVNMSIPYTEVELDGLIEIAEDAANQKIDSDINRKRAAALKTMKSLLVLSSNRDNFATELKVPGVRWLAKKQKEVLATTTLPGETPANIVEGMSTVAGAVAASQMRRLGTTIQSAVVAEAGLRSELFITESAPQPTNPTVKETAEDVAEVVPAEPVIRKRSNIVIQENQDRITKLVEKHNAPDEVIKAIQEDGIHASVVKKLMEDLEAVDGVEGMDKNPVYEKFLKDNEPAFKKGDDVSNTLEAFESEVAQVKQMLPQVPITTVRDVVAMTNKYGTVAIGAYHQGVIEVVNKAKEGTIYHEAFHAVSDLYLSAREKEAIAKERGKDSWTATLEEQLADDFAKHVQGKDYKRTNRVIRFFKSIMDWFTGARSSDVTTKVFNRIARGGYAKNKSINWISNVSPVFSSVDQFKKGLSKKNSVLLQSLLDKNKIEIVC